MKEEIQKVREALKAVAVTSGNSEPYAAFNLIAARIEEMEGALKECADDLEAILEDHYRLTKDDYPSEMRRYERDIAPVRRARAALQSQEKADG